MARRILSVFAAAVFALSGIVIAGMAAPAAAEPAPASISQSVDGGKDDVGVQDYYTRLLHNAYLYSYPGDTRIRTVHAGNIFRVYQVCFFSDLRWWAYGHSEEAPGTNGWILASHLRDQHNGHFC